MRTTKNRTAKNKPLVQADYDMAEKLASIGCEMGQIASMFGFTKRSFELAHQNDEQLRDAIERGREKGNVRVMQTAFQMATNGKNPAMTMFWLKCRMRWRENQTTLYAKGCLDEGDSASIPVVTFVVEAPHETKD
jgi:phage terminase small subunit